MVVDKVLENPSTNPLFKEGEDEISDEELAHSYTILYESWVNTIKINEYLQGQVHQLDEEYEALEREVATLKGEILKNSMAQSKLKHLRKIVKMKSS